jgi:hypothetical protein
MAKTNLMQSSAAGQPAGAMPAAFVDASHATLNEHGVEPQEAARWVVDAIQTRRFWALPPSDDPFGTMLKAELAELEAALR